MPVKIRGGRVNYGDPPLSSTCRFATIVRGQRPSDEIIECGRLSDHSRITFPVTFCTAYSDERVPSLGDMEDIAWVLRSDPPPEPDRVRRGQKTQAAGSIRAV